MRYFGDYELVEEIARGGMGVVYKARQVSLNRIVALKMILAGQLASQADVQRFHTEAEAAANLDHPGIVPIHEVGEHEGQHYFSMGFVDGQSLAERLVDGPLPPQEAAELAKQLAEAVAYAHEQGVIHRDLKPANVLLDKNGQPRITDFGLAKKLEADSHLTGTGQILGTPSYMPPEQAAGKTQEIGPAADVYALGAVLYTMLTGRPPFQAANPMDTLLQVLDTEPVPLRQLDRAIARDLETICLKCLAKHPQRRYASAGELSEELHCFLQGKPIRARPLGAAARGWRWCQRKPLVAGLLFAVAMSLIMGMAVSSYFAILAGQRADLAESEMNRAESEMNRAESETNRAETQLQRAEWLLYASHIAAAQREWESNNDAAARKYLDKCRWDFRGWEYDWLYTRLNNSWSLPRDWGKGGMPSVAYSPDGRRIACAASVAFSPDGRRIAWANSMLRVLDAESGQELPTAIAFSPDGRRNIGESQDHTIRIWDAESGKEVRTIEGHTGAVTSIAFSPDGQRIVTASGDDTIIVWDATNAEQVRTLKVHDLLSGALCHERTAFKCGGMSHTAARR